MDEEEMLGFGHQTQIIKLVLTRHFYTRVKVTAHTDCVKLLLEIWASEESSDLIRCN